MVVTKDIGEREAAGMGFPWWISPLAFQGGLYGRPTDHSHSSLVMHLSSIGSLPSFCALRTPVLQNGEDVSGLLHHHQMLSCHSSPHQYLGQAPSSGLIRFLSTQNDQCSSSLSRNNHQGYFPLTGTEFMANL